jgi:25S rRNA (cytosine2278-C5)-methyltransferase
VTNVVTTILNADFTSLPSHDKQFSKVTSILLDPSCSGSGLLRPEDTYSNPSSSVSSLQTRLRNLSTFQQRLLKHALSFPSVRKVVYSTCSIHAEENEYVVRGVLEEGQGWRVVWREEQPRGVREWERRGWRVEGIGEEVSEGCVRCEKGTDGTIGFFAVGFVRTDGISREKGEQRKENTEDTRDTGDTEDAETAAADDDDDDDDDDGDDGEEWQGIPS